MKKPTPGPYTHDGNMILSESTGDLIAIVHKQDDKSTTKANTLLLVAAPDMLKALIGLLTDCEIQTNPRALKKVSLARTAIRKAQGLGLALLFTLLTACGSNNTTIPTSKPASTTSLIASILQCQAITDTFGPSLLLKYKLYIFNSGDKWAEAEVTDVSNDNTAITPTTLGDTYSISDWNDRLSFNYTLNTSRNNTPGNLEYTDYSSQPQVNFYDSNNNKTSFIFTSQECWKGTP